MTDELVVIEKANIPALFKKNGCDPIIEGLKKEAEKFKGDITTAKGRKEIATFARKFSTAKVYLDKLGKALSDEYRAKIQPINEERNKVETCCNELRDKIRKPLTDWEDAEKKRVADIEARVEALGEFYENALYSPGCDITSLYINCKIEELKAIIVNESFEEFELAATKAKDAALTQLEAKFIVLQAQEREKAEAERIEAARLVNEQKEREEKIAKEAADKARKESEEKAKVEASEKDRKAKAAIEKAEREKLEAKLATEKAEREKKEAEENERRLKEDHQKELDEAAAKLRERMDKEERDKREAAEQAEKDKEAAIEKEKQRQADEIKKDQEAEEKRQANKRHRNKIHKEAKASMLEHGISEEDATIFVTLVKDGRIKHITIDY